jgi:hypothetical protein
MSDIPTEVFNAISSKQDEAVKLISEYIEETFPQVWHWHIWQAVKSHAETREKEEFDKHFKEDGEFANRDHSDFEAHIHRELRKRNPDMKRDNYFLMPIG